MWDVIAPLSKSKTNVPYVFFFLCFLLPLVYNKHPITNKLSCEQFFIENTNRNDDVCRWGFISRFENLRIQLRQKKKKKVHSSPTEYSEFRSKLLHKLIIVHLHLCLKQVNYLDHDCLI